MKRQINQLDVHNIFLAKEYQASFDDIFKRHLLPEDPSFYVNVPSRIDPSGKTLSQRHLKCQCGDIIINLLNCLCLTCTINYSCT